MTSFNHSYLLKGTTCKYSHTGRGEGASTCELGEGCGGLQFSNQVCLLEELLASSLSQASVLGPVICGQGALSCEIMVAPQER